MCSSRQRDIDHGSDGVSSTDAIGYSGYSGYSGYAAIAGSSTSSSASGGAHVRHSGSDSESVAGSAGCRAEDIEDMSITRLDPVVEVIGGIENGIYAELERIEADIEERVRNAEMAARRLSASGITSEAHAAMRAAEAAHLTTYLRALEKVSYEVLAAEAIGDVELARRLERSR